MQLGTSDSVITAAICSLHSSDETNVYYEFTGISEMLMPSSPRKQQFRDVVVVDDPDSRVIMLVNNNAQLSNVVSRERFDNGKEVSVLQKPKAMEGMTASSHSTSTQHRATMDGYRKVEKQKLKSPLSENEIRVASHGLVRNYFYYATTLLQERRTKDIVLKALGRAITKTVIIAELIKKRFPGLHQDTAISSVSITDVWEPIDEVGLETVEKTYHVSMISITLSEKELNKNSPGYQAPSHAEQGQQYNNNYLSQQPYRQSHEVYSSDNEDSCGQGNGCGRGKGCGLNIGGYGNYQGNHPGNCKVICYVSADEEEGSGETKVDTGYSRGGRSEDDDSDDCVILEEDPDKPVKVVNEKVDNDSDDLLVVSEKGQVACRDYPHPRHLCVKFPFATTPHESHCDKVSISLHGLSGICRMLVDCSFLDFSAIVMFVTQSPRVSTGETTTLWPTVMPPIT
nr:glycine-rich cell wall structural protein 1.8 [Ipomoea batatas]